MDAGVVARKAGHDKARKPNGRASPAQRGTARSNRPYTGFLLNTRSICCPPFSDRVDQIPYVPRRQHSADRFGPIPCRTTIASKVKPRPTAQPALLASLAGRP